MDEPWQPYDPEPERIGGGWAIVTLKTGQRRAGWLDEGTFAGVGFATIATPERKDSGQRPNLMSGVTIADVEWVEEPEARAFEGGKKRRSA